MPQLLATDENLDFGTSPVHEDRDEEIKKVIKIILHPQVSVADLEIQVVASGRPIEDHKLAPLDLQDSCTSGRF